MAQVAMTRRAILPEPPTRRVYITVSERQKLTRYLRLYFAWRDGGRGDPPWLRSGVAHATRFDRPRVRTNAPGSRAPLAADPHEDTDGWLANLDRLMDALGRDDPLLVLVLRWKSAETHALAPGSARLTNAEIGARLCQTERWVIERWGQLAVRFINELWPGSSGGFAR